MILKNEASEGPGTIAPFLVDSGAFYNVVEPADAGRVSLEGVDALVVLGGPMGVYEADDYPQVKGGMAIIEKAVKADMPVLGVCLGCQMLASVLGAKVYKGRPGLEVGWLDIELSDEGRADEVFGLYASDKKAGASRVFHWHGDTFDLPRGAARLAGSAMYENQAFRLGKSFGLQFHIEVTDEMVKSWLSGVPDGQRLIKEGAPVRGSYDASARRFYGAFFGQAGTPANQQ